MGWGRGERKEEGGGETGMERKGARARQRARGGRCGAVRCGAGAGACAAAGGGFWSGGFPLSHATDSGNRADATAKKNGKRVLAR